MHKYKSTYRECFYTINLARSFWTDKFRHCRREERGEKYCDHDCVCIYACIYLSAQVSQKPHVQTQRNFLYVLRAVVAWCSYDDNAMRSVLPVLSDWVTSTWFEAAVAQKVWLCVCSEVQIVCIRSSWCHCISKPHHRLHHLNSDWFYLSGTAYPGCCPGKEAVKRV